MFVSETRCTMVETWMAHSAIARTDGHQSMFIGMHIHMKSYELDMSNDCGMIIIHVPCLDHDTHLRIMINWGFKLQYYEFSMI